MCFWYNKTQHSQRHNPHPLLIKLLIRGTLTVIYTPYIHISILSHDTAVAWIDFLPLYIYIYDQYNQSRLWGGFHRFLPHKTCKAGSHLQVPVHIDTWYEESLVWRRTNVPGWGCNVISCSPTDSREEAQYEHNHIYDRILPHLISQRRRERPRWSVLVWSREWSGDITSSTASILGYR